MFPLRTIRFKLIATQLVTAILFVALSGLTFSLYLLPAIDDIEAQAARDLVERFRLQMAKEVETVQVLTSDWAFWDDTYQFVQDKNQAYIASNVSSSTFETSNLNLIAILGLNGAVHHASYFHADEGELRSFHGFDDPENVDLRRFSNIQSVTDITSGIWEWDNDLYIVSATPISDSDGISPPNGVLIMARLLDEQLLSGIGTRLSVHVVLKRNSPALVSSQFPNLVLTPKSDDILLVETELLDYRNRPVGTILMDMPRTYYGIGQQAILNAGIAAIILVFTLLLGLFFSLYIQISRPLKELARTVELFYGSEIEGRKGEEDLPVEREDEIGIVARAIRDMHRKVLFYAHHDQLTELPTLRLARERADLAVALAKREGKYCAMLFLDLDGFKKINDSYGHDAGDATLIEIANRLRSALRTSDTACRIGGDEFLIVLSEVQDQPAVEHLCARLISHIQQPIEFEGNQFSVGASIGAALHPNHGSDFEALRTAADTLMYEVKKNGKNNFRVAG